MARVQRARAGARRGPGPAAARAGEVPRDLQPEPRRVLRGPGVRPRGAAPRRGARHVARRSRSRRAAPGASGAQTDDLVQRQTTIFTKDIAPALEESGIRFADWGELDDADRAELGEVFDEHVFPVLTPLAVDPAHPFPYISNLSLNLAVLVRDPTTGEDRFARVKVPPLLPRFVPLPDGERFLPLEQLIAARLDPLFPGMEVVAHHPFRVTRDADFDLEDEDEDLLEAIESVLHRRTKFGRVVRLEIDTTMSPEVARAAVPRARDRRRRRHRHRRAARPLRALGPVRPRPSRAQGRAVDAADPAGARPRRGDARDLFRSCSRATCSCTTPTTRSPRRSRRSSTRPRPTRRCSRSSRPSTAPRAPTARSCSSLVKAAKDGKQVVALVELKARFDEQANIERARVLEEAGVHIVYGLVGLKTHAKILLVVRQEADGIRRYCHVGTGQLQPEDRHALRGPRAAVRRPRPRRRPHRAVQPPDRLQPPDALPQAARRARSRCASALAERIRREGAKGAAGRIVLKMNSLVDPDLIDELYAGVAGRHADRPHRPRASAACGPQVPGLSETIRVRSLVGRYLEHSRIYRFGADPGTAEFLIGSADLMPRNLDRRVEALVPVDDPRLRARLDEILARRTSPTTCSPGSCTPTAPGTRSTATTASTRRSTSRSSRSHRSRRHVTVEPGAPERPERAGVGLEREVKLAAPARVPAPAAHRPRRGRDRGRRDDVEMTATYYDTADLRLTRAGGAASATAPTRGGSVKLPERRNGDGSAPGAVSPASSTASPAAPRRRPRPRSISCRPSSAPSASRRSPGLHTRRHRIPLFGSDGLPLGELVDDDVTVLEGETRRAPVPRARDRARTRRRGRRRRRRSSRRLRDAGAGAPDPTPKIVRGARAARDRRRPTSSSARAAATSRRSPK